MTSRIIRNPTPDNAPNTIIKPQPDELNKLISPSYVPQDFDDMRAIAALWRTYIMAGEGGNSYRAFGHFLIYVIIATTLCGMLLIAGIPLVLAIALVAIGTGVYILLRHLYLTIIYNTGISSAERNPYDLSREDTKILRSAHCIHCESDDITISHAGIISELRRMLLNKSTLDTVVNLPDLREAYNNYTALLGFFCANRTVISDDLAEKYKADLKYRLKLLEKEVDTALCAIREEENINAQLQHDQQRVIQDMYDNDALNAMPLIQSEEGDDDEHHQ